MTPGEPGEPGVTPLREVGFVLALRLGMEWEDIEKVG